MADKKPRDEAIASDEAEESLEVSRRTLRQRWELASVLNFLSVFEPVIGDELKMSAEAIEMALINPNASLAKLHVALLKGIPPVSKNLSKPDGWVTILCKKLAEWWPWVAEGKLPLTAAKGEEISKYKKLDPSIRLQMLKALCELRTEQDDLVSYINDALKEGKQPSHFRKDKICEDGTGISYWYDGNSVTGHRLYREVKKSVSKPKHKGKDCLDPPSTIEWETLATNLDEFREVLDQLSSRKVGVEASVCKTIETEVIPVLEKEQKKKERALKRQQRQDALLNGYQSFAVGVTRSCRARRPVSYTFDEYDRAIDEALKSTRKRKGQDVQTYGRTRKHQQQLKSDNSTSDEDSEKNAVSEEGSPASTDEEVEDDREVEDSDKEDDTKNSDSSGEDNRGENESGEAYGSESDSTDSDHKNAIPNGKHDDKNDSGSSSDDDHQETRNLGAKNRLRQRPTRNTALESTVRESDDRSSSENATSGASSGSGEQPAVVSDSEDEVDS